MRNPDYGICIKNPHICSLGRCQASRIRLVSMIEKIREHLRTNKSFTENQIIRNVCLRVSAGNYGQRGKYGRRPANSH